ncbi:hypothetical protein Tco_0161543 [Tanacetum coccineum]
MKQDGNKRTKVVIVGFYKMFEIKSAKPKAVNNAATTVTLASSRPKAKGIIFHDQEEQAPASTPIVSPSQPSQVKDKAEEQEEERIAREKAQKIQEANIAWDDIQATVEADYQLAQRLHDEEQEQYTNEEKEKFFCEFLEQRRKFFAAKRTEAKRNKPPTQAQQRKLYCNYLKNMEGYWLILIVDVNTAALEKCFVYHIGAMSTLDLRQGNLFPPLEDPERTIRRRTRVDPNSLNDFEEINMAANENGDDGLPPAGGGLPVPDLRTMEELRC